MNEFVQGERAVVDAVGETFDKVTPLIVEGPLPMPIFCSQESLRVFEPLLGTAPAGIDRYLLLEFSGVWPAKAWPGVDVPAVVREHVDAALAAVPRCRLQIVRQHRAQPEGVWLAIADLRHGGVRRWQLDSYETLLELDLVEALTAPVEGGAALWLTCTHSRRDRCCAKWGLPVQAALRDCAGDDAWQASHVGGHRFAPNVLLLPHGIMLGRVGPANVPEVFAAVASGGLPPLRFWRGRTCLAPHVQAAEILARQAELRLDFGAPDVVEDELEGAIRRVTLRFGEEVRTIRLQSRRLLPLAKSCGEEPVSLDGWAAALP
mgnify:CR=1 FL=1